MKTISYLLLAAVTALSIIASADDYPVPGQTNNQSGGYWIQGEFTSACLASSPQYPQPLYYPINPGAIAPGGFKKFIYTFRGPEVILRTDNFQDALCNGGGAALGTSQTQHGQWFSKGTTPFATNAIQTVLVFDSCFGAGCPPYNPNGIFRTQVTVMQFIGNQLFFGLLTGDGQVLLNTAQQLFLKGTEPGGNLATQQPQQ